MHATNDVPVVLCPNDATAVPITWGACPKCGYPVDRPPRPKKNLDG
jgi:hypothetical protein